MLKDIITSRVRLNLLIKFFLNISNRDYLNSLANEFGDSTNSIRKELNNLSNAGYLTKYNENNKVIYKANKNHPLFNTLRSIIKKHLGIEDIINSVIENIGEIDKIVLLGDYAKGIDSGTIEVLILGRSINIDYLNNLRPKIEKKIKRKVNFFVSSEVSYNRGLIVFES